jgi:nucleoside permease NupC
MNNKGFLERLFDPSFSEFVTTQVIKFIYVLSIIGSCIFGLVLLVGAFKGGGATGFLTLIFCPIAVLMGVLLSRIWCETIIVLFRIAENTGRMANRVEPPK